ncbi:MULTISPECIES: ABC transporter substrate-binding protein [unclassified Sulfitobacter]|uniref:ABC transporter substrate-binding protein n=1 Tax=unclassified Sulfitobacter TaxID=196795 RepID=UPI0007C28E16|nr:MULTISPECIES: ABC transporter substrate-binding protein [unclassified Sulfitobacter]MAM23903.1 branched-chain amino acid ABC transporter substrate-binding protein [Paracoccaceae bacterium]KZX98604.1 branched-chain amino acid ABC transporter substrate-binding protein [Sulfitobacter sp. HI0023]KZY25091.1 branched-chain amino acid ABC transporter substrate-binding protein [Sulfitobacter sp. HI0040]KZZ70059.1 branched-chain amino acid ABC transporter substrate-binding protein [Sulfitobacter sp. |tara:strand:- start:580 stop:1773 length:1194 start_codon:yes stop_codon:yes gene_type:complete
MKKMLMATTAAALLATNAWADAHSKEVKLGIEFGFTGPIESLTGPMAAGAEMAMKEVTDSGMLMDGAMVTALRADSGCIDNGLAVSSAERLIADGINGLIGADCSGVTGAVLQNVAIPNGMVMISPSATSPGLTTMEDNGLFFRTSPSDAREGEVMAEILKERGVESIALTYTNNDYGKGLADAIESSFKAAGGEVTIVAAHEDGKADYSAEMGALASAGGDLLVVAGYLDQGGAGIIKAALDSGAWDTFGLPGGMIGENLPKNIGPDLDGSYGQIAGSEGKGIDTFAKMAEEAGFDGTSPYAPESYDAAALFLLAMQAAGSTDPAEYKDKIMEVANAPGEKVYPGELGKALEMIANGTDIDYVGASAVELIGPGESAGTYRMIEVRDGKNETIGFK